MKLAIFDMDGLLFDSERLFMEKLSAKMQEYGYTLSLDVYLSLLGSNQAACKEMMKKHYGADYPYELISGAAREDFNQTVRTSGMPVKPGIPELLQFFKENKIQCAVASSTETKFVAEYIKLSKLDFDIVIGGDQVHRSKPNPDIFLHACQLLHVDPTDSIVFEDSENGIKAAVNAKIPVICIPDMKQHNPEIQKLCAAVVRDGFEAIEWLKKEL